MNPTESSLAREQKHTSPDGKGTVKKHIDHFENVLRAANHRPVHSKRRQQNEHDMFDPPLSIPSHLKGSIVLFRVFVGDEDIAACTLHLTYIGNRVQYNHPMKQCSTCKTIWYTVGSKEKGVSSYCYSIQYKTGYLKKIANEVQALFKDVKPSTTKEYSLRYFKTDITTDIFREQDYSINTLGLIAFISITADGVSIENLQEYISLWARFYEGKIRFNSLECRVIAFNKLGVIMHNRSKVARLFLLSIILLLQQRFLWDDLLDSKIFTVPSAAAILDAFKISHCFDSDIQSSIPSMFRICFIKTNSPPKLDAQPTLMDFILTCYPNVSEEAVLNASYIFKSSETNPERVTSTIIHIIKHVQPDNAQLYKFFDAVASYVTSFEVLFEAAKTVANMPCDEIVKCTFIEVANSRGEDKVKKMLRQLAYKADLASLEGNFVKIEQHRIELIETMQNEMEAAFIAILRKVNQWEKIEKDLVYQIVSRIFLFNGSVGIDKLCDVVIGAIYKLEVVENVFLGLLAKSSNTQYNFEKFGKDLLKKVYDQKKHSTTWLLDQYRILRRVSKTVVVSQCKTLSDNLHNYIVQTYLPKLNGKKLLEMLGSITEDEKETFQELRHDALAVIQNELNATGKTDLNKWLDNMFGTQPVLCIDTFPEKEALLLTLDVFMEKLRVLQQTSNQSTVFIAILRNHELVKRVMGSNGHYSDDVKRHRSMQVVREVVMKFSEVISSKKMPISTIVRLDKTLPDWTTQFKNISKVFLDIHNFTAIKQHLDRAIQMRNSLISNLSLNKLVLGTMLEFVTKEEFYILVVEIEESLKYITNTVRTLEDVDSETITVAAMETELTSSTMKDICLACSQIGKMHNLSMFWMFVITKLGDFKLDVEEKEETIEVQDDDRSSDDGLEQNIPQGQMLKLLEFVAYSCVKEFEETMKQVFISPDDVSIDDVKQHLAAQTFTEDTKIVEQVTKSVIPDFKRKAISCYFTIEKLKGLADQVRDLASIFKVPVQSANDDIGSSLLRIERIISGTETSLLQIGTICNPLVELYQQLEDHPGAKDVLEELIHSTQMLEFLRSLEGDDLRNLIDAVEEYTEEYVQESTVSDFIHIHGYLKPLLNWQNVESCDQLFQLFWKSVTIGDSNMAMKINNCTHHFHNLKSLYMNVSNRGEVTKEIITNILGKSTITMHVAVDKSNVSIKYTTHSTEKTIHLAELNDLNSRAHLIENTEQETGSTMIQQFVELVELINDVVEIADELCKRGYFDYQPFQSTIQYSKPQNDIRVLRGLRRQLDSELKDWDAALEDCRKKNIFLSFVYSAQIPLLFNYFSSGENKIRAESILTYISPSVKLDNVGHPDVKATVKSARSPTDKLQKLGKILETFCATLYSQREFPAHDNFKQMTADPHACVKAGKLLVVQITKDSKQTIPVMLSLFANTTMTLPLANQVLFCSKSTTFEQVHMAIERCLMCKEQKLYCLAWVDELDYDIQNQLVKILSAITRDSSQSSYLLAVICRASSNHPLVQKFSSYLSHVTGMNNMSITECFKQFAPNTISIASEVPGLGKTEYVQDKACELDLTVHTVPISGLINKEDLIKRIPHLTESHILHLDIGYLLNPEVIDVFLFELLVLKCATSGTHMVHTAQQYTFIEIANTLDHTLRNDLYLVSHFEQIFLEWDDYNSMRVSTELCSPVQVVCHYFDALQTNSIATKDLVFSGKPNIKSLPEARCKQLMKQNFVVGIDMSYNIINVFLVVLAQQLKKLSTSQYFRIANLKATIGEKTVGNVRTRMLQVLIEMSKEFACRSINTCKSTQAKAVLRTDEVFTESLSARMAGMIQWADSNHFLVLFNSLSSHTITPLYRNRADVDTHILELIESQLKIVLPDFHKYDHEQLQKMLEKLVCSRHNPEARTILKQSLPNYALTPDNLIKMVLIALRVRTRLPVILMGETGCGKTSLVRYLAITCGINPFIINFHAGVKKNDITQKVLQYNTEVVEHGTERWVFLDEINACDHLGVINDIMCHHTCDGKPLSHNLVFIAACNPYRLRSSDQVLTAGLVEKAKTDEFSRLVYRVFPLPESMLDYIWDYGVLNEIDERVYINEMVRDVFAKHTTCTIKQKLVELLAESQSFVRDVEKNESCVSLRDVNRCRLLLPWFDTMLIKRDAKHKAIYSNDDRTTRAAILSCAHCYAVRLQTSDARMKYWTKMAHIINGRYTDCGHILNIIREEQMNILNRMNIPEGIAKNTALRENVFVLFVSIMNKMPIFLVGKPGCSKSLSVQLLKNNLRGLDSIDEYFKTLPQLYVVSYQGSEASTSEGILKVFDKAKRYMKHNSTENVLPVVLLDEVGLAEVSTHNPLKVLHSLLEPTDREFPSIAVVGISNWALDAAKMNRAIHLSRPDLSIDELEQSALSISTIDASERIDGHISTSIDPTTLKALAKAYYEYQRQQKKKNFHGLRDFYSLVKCVSREVVSHGYLSTDSRIQNVIFEGLLRNFGGGTELDVIINTFFLALGVPTPEKTTNIETLIEENLNDQQSRHLLLITRGDSLLDQLGHILHDNNKLFEVMFGSNFEDDKCEGYQYRILSKIIHCMEVGKVLILKDLEDIYGSLYDMLNQNYSIVGKRKNCRIALGAHSNPMCQVHDNFKCVVLIEENNVDFSDPPFLNRFEKQHILFSDLLSLEEHAIVDELEKWVSDFADVDEAFFKVSDAFMGFNKDTISSLVKLVTHEKHDSDIAGTDSDMGVIDTCKSMLVMTTPPDAILRLPRTKLATRSEEECSQISDDYFNLPINSGFVSAVQTLQKVESALKYNDVQKFVIFTHSNIHTDMEVLTHCNYIPHVIQLNSIRTEKQLSSEIEKFYMSGDTDSLIVQCQPQNDAENLLLLKVLIEQKEREVKDEPQTDKIVCIVVHVDRCANQQRVGGWQFIYNKEWLMCTVEQLEESSQPLKDVMGWSVLEMIQSPFFSLHDVITENLLWAFTCFKYHQPDAQMELLGLITSIASCQPLLDCINYRITQRIERDNDIQQVRKFHPEHWQVAVACDSESLLDGNSLFGAWMSYLTELTRRHLIKVIWFLEKQSAWNSILTDAGDTLITNLWQQMFETATTDLTLDECIPKGAESIPMSSTRLPLSFPFAKMLFDDIYLTFLLFENDIQREAAYKGIENLESMNEFDVIQQLNQYVPLVEGKCEMFCNATNMPAHYWELIHKDFLLLFADKLGVASKQDNWLQILLCFLGPRANPNATSPMTKTLTAMFLSFLLTAQQFEVFIGFVKMCGKEVHHIIETAVDEYQESDREQITDTIVRLVCQHYLPYNENVMRRASVKNLVDDIPTVLAFCSRLTCCPQEIHVLRLVYDLLRVCPEQIKDFIAVLQLAKENSATEPTSQDDELSSSGNSSPIESHTRRDDAIFHYEEAQSTSTGICMQLFSSNDQHEYEHETHIYDEPYQRETMAHSTNSNDNYSLEINDLEVESPTQLIVHEMGDGNSHDADDNGTDDDNDTTDSDNDDYKEKDHCRENVGDQNEVINNSAPQIRHTLPMDMSKDASDQLHESKSNEEKFLLDSKSIFQFFVGLVQSANSKETSIAYQKLFCLYFRRCINAHPDTPLLMPFLKELQHLPDQSMSYVGAVLNCVFQLDTYEVMWDFLEEVPTTWEGVHKTLDDFCKTAPQNNVVNIMCDVLLQELNFKTLDVWEKSDIFANATHALQTGDIGRDGLAFLIRIAFCKAYVQSFAVVLQNLTERNDMAKSYTFAKIEENFIERDFTSQYGFKSLLQVLLVKHLHVGTLKSLQATFKDLDHTFKSLTSIELSPPDVIESGIGYRCVVTVAQYDRVNNALECMDDVENKFLPLLHNAQHDPISMQEILVAVSERFYWVRLLEHTKDSNKNWASELENKMQETSLSKYENTLLLNLSGGRKDFQHKSLHISTQTNDSEFFQATILIDVLLQAIPFQNLDSCFLATLILEPNKALEMKMTIPYIIEMVSTPITARCECGLVIISCDEITNCSICNGQITDIALGSADEPKEQLAVKVRDIVIDQNELAHPTDEVTKLLLQVATLSAVNTGMYKSKQVDRLYEAFQTTWNKLMSLLDLNGRDLCLFVHMLLSRLFTTRLVMKSVHSVQTEIHKILQDMHSYINHYKADVYAVAENIPLSFNKFLLEIQVEDCKYQSRLVKTPKLDDLRAHIAVVTSLDPAAYPFLKLIHNWEIKLQLVKLLDPIKNFILLLNAYVNHRLSREECRQKEIYLFVEGIGDIKEAFEEFTTAWNMIYEQKEYFADYLEETIIIPKFHKMTHVEDLVVKDQHHIIVRVIEILANWQNAFLYKACTIALGGRTSLAFLLRNGKALLSISKMYQLRRKQLVEFEWETDLLFHVQVDALPGHGTHIIYDLDAIELELANQLLLGKCYIESEDIEPATYKNEMFHSSSQILTELRSKLEQHDIPGGVLTELESAHMEHQGLMNRVNGILEIILPLVLRTVGNPRETIGAFAARWNIDLKIIDNYKMNSLLEKSIELRHLVSLYELSEDRAAEVIVKSLPEQYTARIDNQDDKNALNELDKKIGNVETFLRVLRRIAMRCLRSHSALHVDFAPDTPLSHVINNPSLWPPGMVRDACLMVNQTKLSFEDVMPPSLCIKHFTSIYNYLEVNIVVPSKQMAPRVRMYTPTNQTSRMRKTRTQRRA